ncbi:hypothetical protein V6N13_026596 [Hibiscus sabdariffa]
MEEASKLLLAKPEQHPESQHFKSAGIPKSTKAESTAEPAKTGLPVAQQLQNSGDTLSTFMTQTSAYMARTDQFIQKTDAFMDRTEMRMQNQEAALKSLENQVGQISQAISTRSGKVLKIPTENKQGEAIAANFKAASDTDSPALADTPAAAREDHNIPSEPEEAEITTAAPQPKQPKETTMEESRPPPPFPQRLKK